MMIMLVEFEKGEKKANVSNLKLLPQNSRGGTEESYGNLQSR
jgi:hypothetical protein